MNRTIQMINEMIEIEELEDQKFKQEKLREHKGSEALGESRRIAQLKDLRDLVKQEFADTTYYFKFKGL